MFLRLSVAKNGKVGKREKIYSFVLIIISLEPVIQLSKNLKLPYKKFARKWNYSTRRILQLCGLLFATFFLHGILSIVNLVIYLQVVIGSM